VPLTRRLRGWVAGSRLIEVRDRVGRRSLAELGQAAGLPWSADSLRRIEAAIGRRSLRQLAVVVADHPGPVGAVFARRYPGVQVHVLHHARGRRRAPRSTRRRVTVHHTPTAHTIHEALSAMPAPQVLIEAAAAKPVKTSILRHLLFHVQNGGLYVIDGLHTLRHAIPNSSDGMDVWQALSRILQVKVDPALVERTRLPADELARADAIDAVTHDGHVILVSKSGDHALELHDPDAEAVLAGRLGPAWGRVLDTREPVTEPLRGSAHANMLQETFRTEMPVPRMYLREYRDVVCAPRQLAVQGDVVLPVSFHHGLRDRLQTRSPLLTPANAHFAVLDSSLAGAQRRPGAYYHLDSEFPGHFGHFMTEDIAKLWGWQAARAAYPDAKMLVSTLKPGGGPSTIQRTLLAAWGVDPTDVVCIDRPVQVDVLIGATQMFYNGIYVHPEMHDIWARLREALRTPAADRRRSPRRIFVTRAPDALRPCRNGDEVQALFAEHGFEIVRPELLTVREQVDLFADAETIAGFGGSGMFNALYSARPGRRIIISSDRYLARNEWAIAAAKGDDYHHFFGEAELRPGEAAAGWQIFQSPFSFDFARDGAALRALLRD
jgi:capsular polysaccharide biosynthesis protein